jgi:hypothetical protein
MWSWYERQALAAGCPRLADCIVRRLTQNSDLLHPKLIDDALCPLGSRAFMRQRKPRHFVLGIGPHDPIPFFSAQVSLALTRDRYAALHYLYVISLVPDFKWFLRCSIAGCVAPRLDAGNRQTLYCIAKQDRNAGTEIRGADGSS